MTSIVISARQLFEAEPDDPAQHMDLVSIGNLPDESINFGEDAQVVLISVNTATTDGSRYYLTLEWVDRSAGPAYQDRTCTAILMVHYSTILRGRVPTPPPYTDPERF